MYEDGMPLGTTTGLAWSSMGGEVLYIEAAAIRKDQPESGSSKTPRKATMTITGQLGDVMKESSQLAMILARRHLREAAPEERSRFFEEHEIHVHCPEGATPKDGPSAGVTLTTSLLSLGLGIPCRADLAMTGEVSLNGKVLPVGGIKEKVVAARRAGIKAIALPEGNRRDFDELPEYIQNDLEITFTKDYRDVLAVAFPHAARR